MSSRSVFPAPGIPSPARRALPNLLLAPCSLLLGVSIGLLAGCGKDSSPMAPQQPEPTKDAFAVGLAYNILRYNGAAWTPMTNPDITINLHQVWGSSATDVYAVGAEGGLGTILHYQGTSWTPVDAGVQSAFESVWGSGSHVFVVGIPGDSTLHYDGISWQVATT